MPCSNHEQRSNLVTNKFNDTTQNLSFPVRNLLKKSQVKLITNSSSYLYLGEHWSNCLDKLDEKNNV